MLIKSLIPEIDKVFSEFAKNDSPGCALAIIHDGKIRYKNGYGLANLDYNIPITPSSIFHVVSVSKQFTCFAILLLKKEGKLALDDDIRKYIPEVPKFEKKITIRHLCHHISGLRDQWDLLVMGGWRMDDVITKDHIFKMIKRQKELNFEPGAEYLYSNTGFTLLAEIVSRVSGVQFTEFTRKHIFEPLGMTSTHFHDDHELIVPNQTYSYDQRKEGGFKKAILSYANVGATSLFTTVEDMTRWLANLDDGKVGGLEVRDQMHQQGVLNDGKKIDYAFGSVIGTYKGLKTVDHSGGDAGFRSHVIRFPEEKLGIIVFSNYAMANPQGLTLKIAEIILKKKIDDKVPSAITLDREVLNQYVGKYAIPIGIANVFIKENKLFVEAVGATIDLIPISEKEFILKQFNGKGVFQDIKGGRDQKFTV